jgi:hypothetical protein
MPAGKMKQAFISMNRPCRSSWTGAREIFQAEEYDAGASPKTSEPAHRAEDSWINNTHFEILWKLLRHSLMKSFIKKRTCIVKGTLSL